MPFCVARRFTTSLDTVVRYTHPPPPTQPFSDSADCARLVPPRQEQPLDTLFCGLRIIQPQPPSWLPRPFFSLPCLTTQGRTLRALAAPTSTWTIRPPAVADAPAVSSRFITSLRRRLSKSLTRLLCPTSMRTGPTPRVRKYPRALLASVSRAHANTSLGAWTIHFVLIACLKIFYDVIPGVSQETSWTLTNITYMVGSYIMFHYVRGVPFEFNSGAFDNLNMWEQIDNGAQYTPTKKFLLSVPIVLFLLSTHYTHYDLAYFIINFLAVLAVIIPKLPFVSAPQVLSLSKCLLHAAGASRGLLLASSLNIC